MELQQLVFEFRAKHGFSQEKVAEILGVHVMTIVNIEKGKNVRKTTDYMIRLKIKQFEGKQ